MRVGSHFVFVVEAILLLSIIIAVCSNMVVTGATNNILSYPLPKLSITPNTLTVSGLSSGAYMATQFHVAFSKTVKGAGVFAGGPYYCAQHDFAKATSACMKMANLIDLDSIQNNIQQFEKQGLIDPIVNLKDQSVYLFSGHLDRVVFSGVMHKLREQYIKYFKLNPGKVAANFGMAASHAMITNNYGGKCGNFGSPFINNCRMDGASETFKKVLKTYNPALRPMVETSFYMFPQKGNYSATSFDEYGYIYIPAACRKNQPCRVHVVFHGCLQGRSFIGEVYARNAGYLQHAENNNLIILFPQVTPLVDINPNGCMDWWGYTNEKYATKEGEQSVAVKNMLIDLGVSDF